MAFYNNNFPVGYQPYYQQTYQNQALANQQINQQQQGQRIWVQGESGARSYLVAPNSKVDLWDSERQTIYAKWADQNGVPRMQILDYTVRGSENVSNTFAVNEDKYISKDEFSKLRNDLEAVKGELERIKSSRIKSHKKEGVIDNV
jgi:hypothetical protein